MDLIQRMKFAALVHDLGKIWTRSGHEDFTVDFLKSIIPIREHDPEIFKLIKKTHSFGNPTDYEWLLKVADRKTSELQRIEGGEKSSLKTQCSDDLLPVLQVILRDRLRGHFAQNKYDTDKLREFIKQNYWLDLIKADQSDFNESSLREHLLLTEQVLDLLLKFHDNNPVKRMDGMLRTKKTDSYIKENIKPIPPANDRSDELELLESLVGYIKFNGSTDTSEIIKHFSNYPEHRVRDKLSLIERSGLVEINDGRLLWKWEEKLEQTHPAEETYKAVIIPVSTIRQYLYCNYQVYVRYVNSGKPFRIITVPLGRLSKPKLVDVEKDGKSFKSTIPEIVRASLSDSADYACKNLKLSAELIPGIILAGFIDRLDISKGKITVVESKPVGKRKELKPYDGEVAQMTALALILHKISGINLEDMDYVIEFYDEEEELIERQSMEVTHKETELVEKCLQELAEIATRKRIPKPTDIAVRCTYCSLNAEGACDKAKN